MWPPSLYTIALVMVTYGMLSWIPHVLAQTSTSVNNNLPYNPTLGSVQTTVPWKTGHVSVYIEPYLVVYGGSDDPSIGSSTALVEGTSSLWAWDVRNGSWYQPNVQAQAQLVAQMLPQSLFAAVALSSVGQLLAVVGNTTDGRPSSILQKLDTNSWTWSFPTATLEPPAPGAGYSLSIVNNTLYQYGGQSVNANGQPVQAAVQNGLSLMDANAYTWTTGSNGVGVTEHSTCYLPACNCLVVFGGTSTGAVTDTTANLHTYDLTAKTWSLQVAVSSQDGAAPGARRLHTATCLHDKMVLYGGGTAQPYDSDVWYLDASAYPSLTWHRAVVANITQSPNARMGHSASLDTLRQKIYIYGGWGVSGTNDSSMYVLDINTWAWNRVQTTGYPVSGTSPSSPPTTTNPASLSDTSSNETNTGAIVGGVVGGVGSAVLAALLVFLFLRRRRRHQEASAAASGIVEADATPKRDGYWNPSLFEEPEMSYTYTLSDATLMTPYAHPRASKTWTGTSSQRGSLRTSELGDTDRVISGILERVVPPSHSVRDSVRESQDLGILSSPLQEVWGRGQVLNELIVQKPNEFSRPAARLSLDQLSNVRVDHYSTGSPCVEEPPFSSSMLALRSIQTNDESMRAHPSVPVTHSAYSNALWTEGEDDKWTLGDSFSVGSHVPPINYIPPTGHQFSIATTATTSPSNDLWSKRSKNIPLTHHYPSSTVSVPLAQKVPSSLPPPVSTASASSIMSHALQQRQDDMTLYDSISPLDMLATLGHSNSMHQDSSSVQEDTSDTVPSNTTTHTTTAVSAKDIVKEEPSPTLAAMMPLINRLPRRYQVNPSLPPIVGPANSIVFVHKDARMSEVSLRRRAVIKWFGRREAWERECRTLIKLKGEHAVELLEVLTIQDELTASQQQPRHSSSQLSNLPRASISASSITTTTTTTTNNNNRTDPPKEDNEGIHYVTIMEQLDETLSTALRNARNIKSTWSSTTAHYIARDIMHCLAWCHKHDIAFCDLKPSNIMHYQQGPWKLIDFEASRTIGQECVGVITPRYCPPEVARATTYGLEGANGVVAAASVDMWALGCVIYELSTFQPLFPSNIKDETILHFVSHPSPSTPPLYNGLRWNEHKELEIPQFIRHVPDENTRHLLSMLLGRDPSKRGNAFTLLNHPYFKGILSYS